MKVNYVVCATAMALASTALWAQGAGPTDPQIAAIVVTANQVDVDAGKLAKARSTSKEVKDFAQQMITDHTSVNKSATELVTKLHVMPENSATSESLQKGGDDNLAALKKLDGAAFDRAYRRRFSGVHRRAHCSNASWMNCRRTFAWLSFCAQSRN